MLGVMSIGISNIMAPGKKRTTRAQKNRTVKNEKLASFIKDFDSQVKTIVEELKANVVSSLKDVDSLYNIELIKLPVAIREMCWIDFFAKGGSLKALEEAAKVNVDMEQITSSVTQTPFKPARKEEMHNRAVKRPSSSVSQSASIKKAKKTKVDSIEAVENFPVKSVLRTRTNAKVSTKRLGTARKARVSAANTTAKGKRSRTTPAGSRLADASVVGYTPMVTPKIDTRLFKTPALRTPGIQEPVYTFSANGSPLAGMNDLFINLPAKNGKNIRLTADDIDVNLSSLDQRALENIKLLSSRLEKICKKI
ncbi:borealin isoform X3 [Pseudophryne corroboree]|uniref:borealin isoform X3 n=1 Tax=Pseudophryne corroboree TaxID=495146 RepID=UPI003081B17F